jgi:hypothetical protein
MKTTQLTDQNVRTLYSIAPDKGKQILESAYGKEFFSQKITDRVKTVEDAIDILGEQPENIKMLLAYNGIDKDMIAAQTFIKLTLIARALNQDWKADWTDSNQTKWFPWFEHSASGFRFDGSGYGGTIARTPSRLCFASSELAAYAGKQFIDLYNQFLN